MKWKSDKGELTTELEPCYSFTVWATQRFLPWLAKCTALFWFLIPMDKILVYLLVAGGMWLWIFMAMMDAYKHENDLDDVPNF
jgi:membrane-bound metal-dependent hydrolase YbcI (DUF457 family)